MKRVIRLMTAAAAVVLGALVVAPTAQAADPVFSVLDTQSYEYLKDCSTEGPPYPCTTTTRSMYVEIWTPLPVRDQVTFGYRIEPITATQGVDYTGTTGTAVMAARTNFAFIQIPVILDGVAEPDETLRVRLTSASSRGDISDTGIGTIRNDGQIPADCTLTRPSQKVTSMACTGRPATQRWQITVICWEGGWGYMRASGAIVTGNGTSVAECDRVDYSYGSPTFSVRT